jgi:enoyl-CoA hydratase/carnithine racemase
MPETSSHHDGRIEISIDGAVGLIAIANPARRNALTLAMWRALPGAVATLAAAPDVRVIMITGTGGDFSSGADITEFDSLWSTPNSPYEAATIAAFAALRNARKPTLAAITGHCLGGAVGLAAACDIRFASTSATFSVPAARLGLAYPAESIADLVALIGPGRTRDLLFTGRTIDATPALAIGLIERLFADEDFEERVAAQVDVIAQLAPLTHAATKSAVAASLSPSDETLRTAADTVAACLTSEDYAEGRAAFAARRKPVFRGR